MIVFPNCKINIGLSITGKRQDGYHNIESVMIPVGWHESLEVHAGKSESKTKPPRRETTIDKVHYYEYGNKIPGDPSSNLCIKVFNLLEEWYTLPETSIHLLKTLPMGAGLGAGSSDAAHCLKALKDYYDLNISNEDAKVLLSKIGSDCPFFWENKAKFVFGTGTNEKPISLSLEGWHILIVHPNISVSTKEAYAGVKPQSPRLDLSMLESLPIESWEECVFNDFEESVFPQYPILKSIKENLIKNGAVYASMSGSGSAIYGLFDSVPRIPKEFEQYTYWVGTF